ncbi:FAD-binding protein [Adlercreutzia equolifaciens]|uniref:FAD-binding protein n=1 Tax=Adlercreutzia equolifaciens TaxID=446660 RepID=UPI0023B09312|nr:FAD-binding protein [Adlercreutzia equolifaciens]MDE8701358.1 FAD-binding protein [Adlercreutzia equolifaciens]
MTHSTFSRRDALKLGAGMAAACAGLTALGCAPKVQGQETAEAATIDAAASTGGTRYTKATNDDEIGIVHDAASEEDFDVVVVGSGIAGVVCSMMVAEQAPEAKVLLIEAQGNTGGGTNYAEQPDMPAQGVDWVTAYKAGDEEAATTHFVKDARLLAERAYDIGRNSSWLFTKHAIPLTIKNPERLKQALDGLAKGEPITRWNGVAGYEGGNGSKTIQRLLGEVESDPAYRNVEVRVSTRGTALLVDESDDHEVTGIQVLNDQQDYVNLNAKAVVLACGGMSNNLELLQNYSNQELDHCFSVEQCHYGDGFVMAEQTAHGRCKTIALSSMQAAVDGMHFQSWLNLAVGQTPTALFVNQEGIRFANEDMYRIKEQPDLDNINRSKLVEGQGAVYSILGSNLLQYYKDNKLPGMTMSFYGDGQDERPYDLDADLEEYAGLETVFKADTLEELAEKMGVPADAFVETVTTYDADAKAGADSTFAKDPEYLVAVGEAPYYGFKLSSLIVNTNGGVRVDHDCRVIDQNAQPVNGLYAAGLTISGFVTDVYETGNCQCVSIWSGSKAGRSLVEQRLGGTVADDWFGPSEWDASKDLPTFANQDEYDSYVASL